MIVTSRTRSRRFCVSMLHTLIAAVAAMTPALLRSPVMAQTCQPQWAPGFADLLGDPGLSGQSIALTVFDDGAGPALYAGGQFGAAGTVFAELVAWWDGATWANVANGADGPVRAMRALVDPITHQQRLYIGGSFTMTGGLPAANIGRFDGCSVGRQADLNGDGVVNVFDLSTLLGNWGPCPPAPNACATDLSGDGVVNVFDLAQLVGSWGS